MSAWALFGWWPMISEKQRFFPFRILCCAWYEHFFFECNHPWTHQYISRLRGYSDDTVGFTRHGSQHVLSNLTMWEKRYSVNEKVLCFQRKRKVRQQTADIHYNLKKTSFYFFITLNFLLLMSLAFKVHTSFKCLVSKIKDDSQKNIFLWRFQKMLISFIYGIFDIFNFSFIHCQIFSNK